MALHSLCVCTFSFSFLWQYCIHTPLAFCDAYLRARLLRSLTSLSLLRDTTCSLYCVFHISVPLQKLWAYLLFCVFFPQRLFAASIPLCTNPIRALFLLLRYFFFFQLFLYEPHRLHISLLESLCYVLSSLFVFRLFWRADLLSVLSPISAFYVVGLIYASFLTYFLLSFHTRFCDYLSTSKSKYC